MRLLRLFLFFLVGAFLSGSAVFAFAEQPHTVPAVWPGANDYPSCSGPAFSCGRTCSGGSLDYSWAVASASTAVAYPQPSPPSPKPRGRVVYGWTDEATYTACFVYPVKPICPAGYVWDGADLCRKSGPCEGKGGTEVDDGSVGPDNVKLSLSFPTREDGNYVGQFFCSGGCEASVTREIGSVGIGMGGRYYNTFGAKFDGLECAPPGESVGPGTRPVSLIQKTSKEYDCLAAGKAYGYVNNVVVCTTPSDKSGKSSEVKEKKNPDGTSTKTVVEKSVVCTGEGSCTTTTTTTTTVYNADGTQASTKSETQEETSKGQGPEGSGFCKENPSLPICKTGSFSGSCGAAPTCEGDPIQCATAKATWETNCKTMKPGEIKEAPDVGTKKIEQNFEHSDLGGGGSCPAPRPIALMGRTIYFEMTPICEFASGIRPVVILLGWIAAGYIVMGYGRSSAS